MQLPDDLTPEAHAAIIACFRIAAAREQALRLAREQAEREREADTQIEPLGTNVVGDMESSARQSVAAEFGQHVSPAS